MSPSFVVFSLLPHFHLTKMFQIRIIDYKRITLFSIGIIMIGIFVYVKFDWLWKLAHNPMTYFVASLVRVSITSFKGHTSVLTILE